MNISPLAQFICPAILPGMSKKAAKAAKPVSPARIVGVRIAVILGASLVLGFSLNSFKPGPASPSSSQPTEAVPSGPDALPVAENGSPVTWDLTLSLLQRGKIVLVDARYKPNYDVGHVPGAVLFPSGSLNDKLDDFQKKYPVATPLVVYCSDERCHSSQELVARLLNRGYKTVRYVPGGYAEWKRIAAAAASSAK
jgi:rhodanese-related sulfurtransferase